mmetsp:Transcript_8246/g.11017  ORF Transcript_8246/g.11017 Transcript_8246/m.11017 type:complete len:253 (-) Transcript_8246:23-781(-)|eukprot:CAMPEP_0201482196 /NCGR_PEP_ID=MMETSP0151_2-20130828/6473_1 /ASSEMBLY_ACC=CAM_ASM_000257 /TAXON_ID=200890 /ORGANISM="Paramoeba atlantica, Strain 621/1 / CCAP 1560/9" /LENGTH=252 /DNA_ID=CAMNT_0047864773 /DNA_START=82 /DNA_END=840 /DNA_ORIENTATION=+
METKIPPYSQYILFGFTGYVGLFFLLDWIGYSNPFNSLITIVGMSFGVFLVHSLGSLSERLEEFDKQNKQLEETNGKLSANVDQFRTQNEKMKETTDGLEEQNTQFKQRVEELGASLSGLDDVRQSLEDYAQKTGTDLQEVIGTIKTTLQEQNEVVEQQKELVTQTEKAQREQEKVLLLSIHSQCQYMDQSHGMSPMEFEMFKNMIPEKYKKFSGHLSFDEIDADKDGTISTEEFSKVIEKLIDLAESGEAQ